MGLFHTGDAAWRHPGERQALCCDGAGVQPLHPLNGNASAGHEMLVAIVHPTNEQCASRTPTTGAALAHAVRDDGCEGVVLSRCWVQGGAQRPYLNVRGVSWFRVASRWCRCNGIAPGGCRARRTLSQRVVPRCHPLTAPSQPPVSPPHRTVSSAGTPNPTPHTQSGAATS